MKKAKQYIALVTICAMTAAMMTGCAPKEEAVVKPDVVTVEARLPQLDNLVLTNEFIGTVSPQEEVYVMSMVSAEVMENYVSVGDVVAEGDTLCKLDDEAAQLTLENANASYNTAKASVAQAQGAATELQDIQTQSNINNLEKQISSTEKKIKDTNNDLKETAEDLDEASDAADSAESTADSLNKKYKTAKSIATKWMTIQATDYLIYKDMTLSQGAVKAAEVVATYEAEHKAAASADNGNADDGSAGNGSTDGSTESDNAGSSADSENTDGSNADDADDTEASSDTASEAVEAYTADTEAVITYADAPPTYTYTDAQYENAKTVLSLAKKMKSAKLTDEALTKEGMTQLAESAAKAQTGYQSAAAAEAQLEAQRKAYQQGVESAQEGLGTLKDNLNTAKQSAELSQGQARNEQNAVLDAQLNAAGVGVKSAQMQLDLYTITSPISGTVEAVNVSEHGFATTGNPAYIISNKDSMTTTFSVSEGIRNTFVTGQKITVDKNGAQYEGTITEISPMVNPQTGLFTIKANVSATGEELLTGTKVKIRTETYKETDTLIIPYDAVYYDNGQAYVYAVEDGYAKRINVETGLFDATRISIISGITADTQIITTWSAGLKDGALVEVKEEAADNTEVTNEEVTAE